MTHALLVEMPGNEAMAQALADAIEIDRVHLELRRFPDDESYVRFRDDPRGRPVTMLCTLDRPDAKLLPLLFAAGAARDLGATSVGLIAPYLAYMRQDRRFLSGEAVTSKHFSRLISSAFDWLITIDPHLHRRHGLSEIYSIPTRVLHAMPLLASWINENVQEALLVGPDIESDQWVAATASLVGAPHIVLQKTRRGDRDVEVTLPPIGRWRDRTPVLVDDIISTARTMIDAIGHLARAGMRPAVCVGVHGVFAGKAYEELLEAGAARVVTTNTIIHASNAIDVATLLLPVLSEFVRHYDALAPGDI